MNVAMVLDLSEQVPVDVAVMMRAVVTAFGRAHDLGDAFSLHVAGPMSGIEVSSESFRHGALSLALNQLFGEGGEGPGEERSLLETLARASEVLAESDDSETQLGTSLLLLVTGRELGDELLELSGIAHRSAVAGLPLSAVGLGNSVDPEELDDLVRDGQGRRRLLADPSAASELLERELSSASQVVARALRLSIRLAPGVQLIDVLGSRRVGEDRAERIREAERSVDLRVARDLGIVMDRGVDEEGIQIVIPAFQAGDAHVVLLDIVVPGPGPLAEVTARYKDLVEMRNGTSRATIELARGGAEAGLIERNVIVNLMARRLADTLRVAGDDLRSGDDDLAINHLVELRALLQGLVEESKDYAMLADDVVLLDRYLFLLGGATLDEEWGPIADSLQVAGHRKMHPKEKK
jgi:hypothetical protein